MWPGDFFYFFLWSSGSFSTMRPQCESLSCNIHHNHAAVFKMEDSCGWDSQRRVCNNFKFNGRRRWTVRPFAGRLVLRAFQQAHAICGTDSNSCVSKGWGIIIWCDCDAAAAVLLHMWISSTQRPVHTGITDRLHFQGKNEQWNKQTKRLDLSTKSKSESSLIYTLTPNPKPWDNMQLSWYSRALVHWLTSLTLLSPRRAAASPMCRLNAHLASTETWLSRPPAANAAVTAARPASPAQHPGLWPRTRSLLWERSSAAWSAKVGPGVWDQRHAAAPLLSRLTYPFVSCVPDPSFAYITHWAYRKCCTTFCFLSTCRSFAQANVCVLLQKLNRV